MITPKKETVLGIQEQITSLAEDIIDLDDWLTMLWEKIVAVEKAQVVDIENLSDTIDILECLQKANKAMLEVVMEQDDQIKLLDEVNGKLFTLIKCTSLVALVAFIISLIAAYNVFF